MSYNAYGLREWLLPTHEAHTVPGTEHMTKPVRCCHCRTVYDIGALTDWARYLDCTAWRCPGCNLLVDDRCENAPGWTARKDYDVLPRTGGGRRG